jgi:hypothetical protein
MRAPAEVDIRPRKPVYYCTVVNSPPYEDAFSFPESVMFSVVEAAKGY